VSHGRDVLFTFQQHIGMALQAVKEHADAVSHEYSIL